MNNFLALGAVVACGWAASNVVLLEPAARPVSSRPTTVAAPAYAFQPIVGRNVVEARRAPVPLIRNTRPPVVAPTSIDTSSVSADAATVSAEQKAQDDERQDDLTGKLPRLRWKRTDTNVQLWLAKLATEVGEQRPTEEPLKSGSRWMALEGCRWTEQPRFDQTGRPMRSSGDQSALDDLSQSTSPETLKPFAPLLPRCGEATRVMDNSSACTPKEDDIMRINTFLSVSGLVLALSLPSWAQVQTLPTHTVTINGTVETIDKAKRVVNIKTSDGKFEIDRRPSERDTLQ